MRKTVLAVSFVFLLAAFAKSQDHARFDFSVSEFAAFSKTATSFNGTVSDKPTTSGGFLISFRYRATRMHGIQFNIASTRNGQIYTVPPDVYRIQASLLEYSVAYVFSPFSGSKLEPFLLAGGGGLSFDPGNTYIDGFQNDLGARKQTGLAVLYGGGADYHLWRALGLRLQYRGLIYKNPSFGIAKLTTGVRGHMAEPSAGIVVRF